jgi:NAD(P)-dependent dehydrogenase (short-subunit alcohol dehydrogenase family)
MELGLKGKVALVTGSSRGIGRGIALAFADEGCDLLLTGRDAVCVLDLREPSAAGTLVAAVQREFDGLDILVNNAGATKRGDFFALTDADWEDGYALKFFAHVRLARAAWPLLKEAKIRAQFCREAGIIRYGKVEDVADFVAFIVSSRATWLHGATLDLDGGEIPVL